MRNKAASAAKEEDKEIGSARNAKPSIFSENYPVKNEMRMVQQYLLLQKRMPPNTTWSLELQEMQQVQHQMPFMQASHKPKKQ